MLGFVTEQTSAHPMRRRGGESESLENGLRRGLRLMRNWHRQMPRNNDKVIKHFNSMAAKLGEIYKSEGVIYQVQGNDKYYVSTNKYSDGSITRSGWIGDMSIENIRESWDLGASSADYILSAWYPPKATKTTENGLEYLGNGAYIPSNITIETLPRQEIIIQKNPAGFKRPIIDNIKAERLRTIALLYTSFPDSDGSNIDGYDATLTQDKPTLKRLDMVGYLPNNWWKDPFVIINSKKEN